jgi:hypothetical protein
MNLLSLRLSLVYAGILASSVLSCRGFAASKPYAPKKADFAFACKAEYTTISGVEKHVI